MFVDRVGPVDAVAAIRAGTRAGRRCSPRPRRGAIWPTPRPTSRRRDRRGIRLVVPESDEWPHFAMSRARAHRRGPRRGVPRRQARARRGGRTDPAAGAVGARRRRTSRRSAPARRASSAHAPRPPYGDHVTAEFGFGLAAQGVAVVSGGAYGIDAAAHRGALAADGTTVAVSAGGLDRPYPTGNADLFERIAASGLLISESPPGCAPHRHRFLTPQPADRGPVDRRRRGRGGAHAPVRPTPRSTPVRLGRPLMAVPGPVTSAMSVGCHTLIRGGAAAVLVTSVDGGAAAGRADRRRPRPAADRRPPLRSRRSAQPPGRARSDRAAGVRGAVAAAVRRPRGDLGAHRRRRARRDPRPCRPWISPA